MTTIKDEFISNINRILKKETFSKIGVSSIEQLKGIWKSFLTFKGDFMFINKYLECLVNIFNF